MNTQSFSNPCEENVHEMKIWQELFEIAPEYFNYRWVFGFGFLCVFGHLLKKRGVFTIYNMVK